MVLLRGNAPRSFAYQATALLLSYKRVLADGHHSARALCGRPSFPRAKIWCRKSAATIRSKRKVAVPVASRWPPHLILCPLRQILVRLALPRDRDRSRARRTKRDRLHLRPEFKGPDRLVTPAIEQLALITNDWFHRSPFSCV